MLKVNWFKRGLWLALAMFIIAAMPNHQALAALVKCRTDPIFFLSNGDMLTVTLDISADMSNIRNVSYIVHVPAGVTIKKVIYTPGGLGTDETYKLYQDSPSKTYTTDTVITTQNTGSVPVVATTTLNGFLSRSVVGYSGLHLIVTLQEP